MRHRLVKIANFLRGSFQDQSVCNRVSCQAFSVGWVERNQFLRGLAPWLLVLRIVKTLPFIHQPDRVAPKASDVSVVDWLYQHTLKKKKKKKKKSTTFFHMCRYGFSWGRKSLYNTAVYVINIKPFFENDVGATLFHRVQNLQERVPI